MVSYPEDASLRSRLGDVYWKLGYPVQAGRFWFLDSPLEGEKLASVDLFIRSCHSDPSTIFRRLKLKTSPKGLEAEARIRLEDLLRSADARLPASPAAAPEGMDATSFWIGGCVILLLLILSLAIIGVATVVDWLR